MSIRHAQLSTDLGELTLVATGATLTGLYFPHHWYSPRHDTFGPAVSLEDDDLLRQAAAELEEYLRGERRAFEVPMSATGSDLQRRVWNLVAQIPYGEVRTYGELAAEIAADPGDLAIDGVPLAKVVGQAVGRNPLCVFIPCHRVVEAGGKITGYAGGIDRKRALLDLEEPALTAAGRLF